MFNGVISLAIICILTLFVKPVPSVNVIPDGFAPWIRVVEGELDDREQLDKAMEGIDVVVSLLEGDFASELLCVFR